MVDIDIKMVIALCIALLIIIVIIKHNSQSYRQVQENKAKEKTIIRNELLNLKAMFINNEVDYQAKIISEKDYNDTKEVVNRQLTILEKRWREIKWMKLLK